MFIEKRKRFLIIGLIIFCFSNVQNLWSQKPKTSPDPKRVEIISRADDLERREIPVEKKEVKNPDQEDFEKKLKELTLRIKSLENNKQGEYNDSQKRLLLSLDILTKTEQRAENLRKQLIDLIERETNIKSRLEGIEYNLRPEIISRSTAIYGSLRPEDIRDQRRKSLESEKSNLESLLRQIQTNRSRLEESLKKADEWVEKVRLKFEKQIDKALEEKEPEN